MHSPPPPPAPSQLWGNLVHTFDYLYERTNCRRRKAHKYVPFSKFLMHYQPFEGLKFHKSWDASLGPPSLRLLTPSRSVPPLQNTLRGPCALDAAPRLTLTQNPPLPCTLWTGFDVPEIPECLTPMGLQSGKIPDSAMTASSIACQPYLGRLWKRAGGWCAAANDVNQWLQIDFGEKFVKLQRVETQGRQAADQWVTRYRLEFSYDGVFFEEYAPGGERKVSVISG